MVAQADFLSLINTTGTLHEAFSSGDANAKTNAVNQVSSMALSCIWNAVSKIDSAKSETDKNEHKAKDLDTEAGKIKNNTIQKAEKIISEIETNIGTVEELLKQLEQAGKNVADYNTQLEEQRQIIMDSQAIVNDSNSSREEKRKALENISAAGKQITALAEVVQDIVSQTGDVQVTVQELGDANESLNEEASDAIADGTQEMQVVIERGNTEVISTLPSVITSGNKDITTGTALVSKGTPMLATPATAVVGAQLVNQGNQSITAGGIKIEKSAVTMSNLTSTLAFAGQNLTTFNNFTTSLGGFSNMGINLLDKTGALWEPFIASTGSWNVVSSGVQEIVLASDETLSKVEANEDEEDDVALEIDSKKLEVVELAV